MPGPPTSRRIAVAVVLGGLVLGACSSSDDDPSGFRPLPDTPVTSTTVTASSIPEEASTMPDTSTTSSTSSTSSTTSTSTTTTIDPLQVVHAYPVDPSVNSSWTPEAHSNYRATDIFASSDCGTPLFAPVGGVVDEVRPDRYDRDADDPALRGGNSLSIIGDDGVRYYMAHFQEIDPAIVAGVRVEAGQAVGLMGDTGRAGACHLHFGLSLPCPDTVEDDWWVRRGVIWPDQYLASWKEGGNASPLAELQAWFAEYPDACRSVEDTPYPRA